MMEVMVDEKEKYRFKVFKCGGQLYIEGVNLDLLGLKRVDSPNFMMWSQDKYIAVSPSDIERMRSSDPTGHYEYVPDYFDISYDQISKYIRTYEEAASVKALPYKKLKSLNDFYTSIIFCDNEKFNKDYNNLLRLATSKELSSNPYEKEAGRTISAAISHKVLDPSFLEYLGNTAYLGHPEWMPKKGSGTK